MILNFKFKALETKKLMFNINSTKSWPNTGIADNKLVITVAKL